MVHAVIDFDTLVFQFLADELVFNGDDVSAFRRADCAVDDFGGELANVDGFAGFADFGHLIEINKNHAVSPRADENVAFMHCHVGGVGFSRLTALFFGSVDAEVLTGEPRIGFDGFGDVVLDTFHGSPVLAITGMVAAGDAEEILGDIHPTVRTGVKLDFKAEHFRLLIVDNGFQLCLMVSAYHGRGVFSIFRRVAVMVRNAAGMGLDCPQWLHERGSRTPEARLDAIIPMRAGHGLSG